MPILGFKTNLNINDYQETIWIYFDTVYDSKKPGFIKLNNSSNFPFDSGDYRIKIDNAVKKINKKVLTEYDNKNMGVRFLGLLDYFTDEIPNIYYIRFESKDSDSIYYSKELEKIKNKQIF